MQQWPAIRPRCHSDPVDSSIFPFEDYEGFAKSASETLWEDNTDNRADPCMFTALSQAMAVTSCQRLCENMSSSPVSFVSSSITSKTSTASRLKSSQNNHTVPIPISTTLVNMYTSDEQNESYDGSRSSPDSLYETNHGLPADTTVVEHGGSPLRDPVTGLVRPKRRPYSKLQLMHLEQEFQQSMYPCRERRAWLSQLLSLTERQVKIWFQNRRTKLKRTVERERKEHEQMQRDMATLAMQFYAPSTSQQ